MGHMMSKSLLEIADLHKCRIAILGGVDVTGLLWKHCEATGRLVKQVTFDFKVSQCVLILFTSFVHQQEEIN